MVGFVSEPTTTVAEQEAEDYNNQSLKPKTLRDPIVNFDSKLTDLSFADSLLDFDFISEFLDNNPEPDRVGFGRIMENDNDGSSVNSHFKGSIVDGSDPVVKEEKEILELDGGGLGPRIEEDMRRISLAGGLSSFNGNGGRIDEGKKVSDVEGLGKVDISHGSSSVDHIESVAKTEVGGETAIGNVGSVNGSSTVSGNEIVVDGAAMRDKNDGQIESASESDDTSFSSSSSSSSSHNSDNDDDENESSDEETKEGEGKEKMKTSLEKNREVNAGEMEEGEIAESNDDEEEEDDDVDQMVDWDDIELENEEDAGATGGPIRSKNELQVLPPVPPVNVTLQPHHQMLPVGVVLSILGAQVIVEGEEKHNPLGEGSILWITESRSPLGLVDEIFGPVKNPYYIVRYNSESEVSTGLHVGSSISFVAEFANHVLNDKDIYKKGYDASNENDEEVSDEVEFSDDEKEAEYKRMLKMSKRGTNDQMVGNKRNNRKKGNNRDQNWKNNKPPGEQTPTVMGSLPTNQNQNNVCPVGGSTSGAGFVQKFSAMTQPAGVFQPSNGVWGEGVNSQQPLNAVLPFGFPPNNMPWPAQSQLQLPYQIPVPNNMPFQQFNPSAAPLSNAASLGGQPLFLGGPAFSSWSGALSQNSFNQTTFRMGLEGQPPHQFMNVVNMGDQGTMSNTNSAERKSERIPGNAQARQHFNMGSRGRKPHQRWGGRFAGGSRGGGRSK